jgi:hypothetical protein
MPLQWAVVFAQLLIGGTHHGIHGFLVPIRNKQVGPPGSSCSAAFRVGRTHGLGTPTASACAPPPPAAAANNGCPCLPASS